MTLTDLLPSLRTSVRPRLDPAVWPVTARWDANGDLLLGGVPMTALAESHGTAVHVLTEPDVRARCAEYVRAFGPEAVSYSAKAGLTVEAGRWIAAAGLGCYVSSAAQMPTALLAGFAPERIVLHGSAKSIADLDAAYACGAAVVAGTPGELARIAARAPYGQRILLRMVPSIAGQGWMRYGFRLGSRPALMAIQQITDARNMVLAGIDCSLGHQISRFQQFESCLREAMAFAAVVRARCRVTVPAVNLGGGHAVACAGGDEFAVAAFAARVRAMVRLWADRYHIDEPCLTVSPGRAVVARAGLTLARVTAVTSAADGGVRIALDGVAGCPVHAPCAGRHEVRLIGRISRARLRPVTVVAAPDRPGGGPVAAAELPADVAVGDLVAVAGTGAYHHERDAPASRPAVVGVAGGMIRPVRRRPTVDDLLRSVA